MTPLPYHLHLTSEVTWNGGVIFCAEHEEIPLVAFGLTAEDAIRRLGILRHYYFLHLDMVGERPPAFVDDAQIYDWVPDAHRKSTAERR